EGSDGLPVGDIRPGIGRAVRDAGLLSQVDSNDLRAHSCETGGDGPADAAARSSDNRDAIAQIEHLYSADMAGHALPSSRRTIVFSTGQESRTRSPACGARVCP